MSTYRIKQATATDLDAVTGLIEARTAWLARRGSDQWSTNRDRLRPRMADRIEHGLTWMLTDPAGTALGTITISTDPDPDFWTTQEQTVPALYLSRMATAPKHAGQRLGHLLLMWAVRQAAQRGLAEVRLDAWKTATGLHAYYLTEGWRHLRTVDTPGRYSGALFSRRAELVDVPGVQLAAPTADVDEHGAHGVAWHIGQDAG